MLRDFPIGIKTAKELIETIEIAQNEGYGHSDGIYFLLDRLRAFIKEEE